MNKKNIIFLGKELKRFSDDYNRLPFFIFPDGKGTKKVLIKRIRVPKRKKRLWDMIILFYLIHV